MIGRGSGGRQLFKGFLAAVISAVLPVSLFVRKIAQARLGNASRMP